MDRFEPAPEAREPHALLRRRFHRHRAARAGHLPARARMTLPNPVPRPPGELERLEDIWRPPTGFRFLTVVNNTYIGLFYIGTAFLFFLLAGVLALLMRTQLALPENDFLGQDRY